MAGPFQITFDCADADRMAEFWSIALDYRVEPPPTGYLSWGDYLRSHQLPVPPAGSISAIVDPDREGPRIVFLRAAEGALARTRVHLDIRAGATDGAKTAKVAALIDAGATQLRRVDEDGDWWVVLVDPEGNEFCVT
ncbi:MAG: VOC family protein [Ilumatobacteraceae bacterium]